MTHTTAPRSGRHASRYCRSLLVGALACASLAAPANAQAQDQTYGSFPTTSPSLPTTFPTLPGSQPSPGEAPSTPSGWERDYGGKIPLYYLRGYGAIGLPAMFANFDDSNDPLRNGISDQNLDAQFRIEFQQAVQAYRGVPEEEFDHILRQLYVRLGYWNTLTNVDQGDDYADTDDDSRRQIEDELVANERTNRSVILMGHSYGGDTAIKIARCIGGVDADCITGNMKRANDIPWTVLYLGLIDPVKGGGLRSDRVPTENVLHFDNFMSPKAATLSFPDWMLLPDIDAIPVNNRSSGILNSSLAGSSFQSQLTYIADWSGTTKTRSNHQNLVDQRYSQHLSLLIFDSLQRILGRPEHMVERPQGAWIAPNAKGASYVPAGKDPSGTLTYGVCRDRGIGVPGTLVVEWNKCYFPRSSKEHVRVGNEYEVLRNDGTYSWTQYSGRLPDNAVRAGNGSYQEEEYVCKTNYRDSVGVFIVSTATCYIPLSGREDLHFKDFSILTKRIAN